MSAERELLLACARRHLLPEADAVIARSIASGIDWDAFDTMARIHGLSPLLHRHLGGREDVPKPFRASLWARHESLARRNAAMAMELAEIVRELAARGFAVVPYKGPTLAAIAYGDTALREFGDLDLLVRPEDALAIAGQLAPRGYEIEYRLPPALLQALVRSPRHYELPLRDARRRLLVELHWRSDPEFHFTPVNDPAWWSRLERIEMDGVAIPSLPSHELLLALCLHGTKHAWCSLGWLVDVAELLRAIPAIDWRWVTATATHAGAARHVALGLALGQRLLAMPLPPEVETFVRNAKVERLVRDVEESIFAPAGTSQGAAYVGKRLGLRTGVFAKARYGLQMLFTPGLGEWQRWPSLPRSLAFLYWPLRQVRLAEKYLLRRTPPAATPRTPPPQPHSTG